MEVHRQKKLDEQTKIAADQLQQQKEANSSSSSDESMPLPNSEHERISKVETPTSTLVSSYQTTTAENHRKSPKPDVVSSTLISPKERQSNKSLEMLRQIFPGKPQKILEAKLRESKGDIVKALESCARHFDSMEAIKNHMSGGPPTAPPPPPPAVSKLNSENNNNPFLPFYSESLAAAAAGKLAPPFSAAMAAVTASALASQHKSAFMPHTAGHPIYRTFEHPNFFQKDLFPFPPPIFHPSFFVGFGSNPIHHQSHHHQLTSPINLQQPVSHHRPCVDPMCSQCTPKVDSTANDEITKEEAAEEIRNISD